MYQIIVNFRICQRETTKIFKMITKTMCSFCHGLNKYTANRLLKSCTDKKVFDDKNQFDLLWSHKRKSIVNVYCLRVIYSLKEGVNEFQQTGFKSHLFLMFFFYFDFFFVITFCTKLLKFDHFFSRFSTCMNKISTRKKIQPKKKFAIRVLFKFFYYYFIYFKYNENNYIKVFQVILLNFGSLRCTLIHSFNNDRMVSATPSNSILFYSVQCNKLRTTNFHYHPFVQFKSFTLSFYVSALLISCDFLAHSFYDIVYHLLARHTSDTHTHTKCYVLYMYVIEYINSAFSTFGWSMSFNFLRFISSLNIFT